jgi:hypothetical protein
VKAPQPLLDVARRLGQLRDEAVFVGGMVRGLLITDPAAGAARPTDDVDLIVDVDSATAYHDLGQRLRSLGFQECTDEDAPLCRWVVEDVRADVMPIDPGILGFSNAWYADAIPQAISVATTDGAVRILAPPHFVATKLEAFASRGDGDFLHHDIEDVVALVDGRAELLEELRAASEPLRQFVAVQIGDLLASERFVELLPGHLEGDDAGQGRLGLLRRRLEALAGLAKLSGRVRSSNLDAVVYDGATRVMTITFTSGAEYAYSDVPPNVHAGLVSAASKGRYFHAWIRGRYRYTVLRRGNRRS